MFTQRIPIIILWNTILLLATSTKPAISQDHLKLAWMRVSDTIVRIYDSATNSTNIIYDYNNTQQTVASKFASNVPTGLICWIAYSKDYKYFIQCYREQKSSTFHLPLPVLNMEYITPPSDKAIVAIHSLQIDPHGNNVYWSDPRDYHVWATSFASNSSKLILFVESHTNNSFSQLLLNIDDRNGYFFAAQIFQSTACWGRIQDTANGKPSVCILNHPTFIFQTGLVSDPLNRILYLSTLFGLFSAHYSPEDLSPFRRINGNAYWHIQYYQGYLFAVTKTIQNEILNVSSSREKDYQFSENIDGWFTIFQDYRDGALNPCINLSCTHLCLPTYKGYRCACPSGFTLVQGRRCLPSVIIYSTTNEPPNLTNHVCKIPTYNTESADGASEETCPPEIVRSNLDSFPHLVASFSSDSNDYVSIPDPYGVGLLKLGRSDRCIQVYTFRTQAHSNLYCGPEKISFFGVDFLHALLFRVHATDVEEHIILGAPFPLAGATLVNPLGAKIASFAIDPIQQRQYWLALPPTLLSSKYDGRKRAVIQAQLSFSHSPMLQLYQNRLLWRRNSLTSSEIVAMDLDTTKTTPIGVNSTQDIRHFIVLPILEPNQSHPCQQAPCSHSCYPYSPTEFACGCPEPLKLIQNQCEGFQLYYLSGNQEGATLYQIQNATIPGKEINTLSTGNEPPQNILFDFCNNQRDICFKVKGQSTVNSTASHLELTINPNTTMLIFDLSGQQLFFNDGYLGNITLKSLRKDTDFSFQPFYTPNATAWALDTQKKIFFWSNGSKLSYVALYDTLQEGHLETLADSSSISALTLDMFSRTVYFLQGLNLKRIIYKHLFQQFKGIPKVATLYTLQQSPIWNLQFYEQALYWAVGSNNSTKSIRYFDLEKNIDGILWTAAKYQTLLGFVLRLRKAKYVSQAYDPCTELPCSHFCFPVPPLEDSRCSYDCGCPERMRLNGKRDCEDIPLPISNATFVAWVSVGAVLSVLLISGLVAALVNRSRRNVELNNLIDKIQNGNLPAANAASNQAKKAQYLPLTCIIPPSDLFVDTTKLLGEGTFGVVLQGVYLNSIVAVKSLKPSIHVNLDQLSEFAKEIKIMDYIGYHPNIARFFGAEISNIKKGSMYAVLEFSRFGSLLSVLRKPSPDLQQAINIVNEPNALQQPAPENQFQLVDLRPIDANETPVLSTHLLLKWAENIASGMQCLSEKSIVHGDLATRNVLVFDNNVAKISDFGLSRQLYNYANYTKKSKGPLPWKWMAIESLQTMEFSTKSDVWAYGVTLWEIFSFGHVPYPEQQWTPKFAQLLRNGLTLQKPEAASQPLYDHVMKPCWALNPEQRPNFLQILETFKSIRRERALQSNDDYEFITAES